jgi:hypothetical protein
VIVYIKLLFIGLLVGGTGFVGYQQGKKLADAEWIQKENKWMIDSEKMRGGYEEIIKSERIRQEVNLMRVINEKQEAQSKLAGAMHELATRGLYVDTGACASTDGLPGEAKDTGKPDRAARPGKVRLHGKSEEDILAMIKDGKDLFNKYNELRKACLPAVQVIKSKEKGLSND